MRNYLERLVDSVEGETLSFDPYHIILTNGLEMFSFVSFVNDTDVIMKDPMTLSFFEDPSDQRCMIAPLSRYSTDQFVTMSRSNILTFLSLDPSYIEVYKDMLNKGKRSAPADETIH